MNWLISLIAKCFKYNNTLFFYLSIRISFDIVIIIHCPFIIFQFIIELVYLHFTFLMLNINKDIKDRI